MARAVILVCLLVCLQAALSAAALRRETETADPTRATVRIHASEAVGGPVPRFMTGKFCEHLGANIYNGMDAQVLRNPTFAEYPFWSGGMTPDGVTRFHSEDDKIIQELRRQAARWGWPEKELDGLVTSRADGLACGWARAGSREAVQVSPDAGPHGGRAQRIEVRGAGQGIAQWAYLPLHRTRRYEVELFARSPELEALTVSLTPLGGGQPATSTAVNGLSRRWQRLVGSLEVPAGLPADLAYRLEVTAGRAGQWVLGRVLLRPADHIQGADPDVVRMLKESRLPLLRWPGGNFVSGYHWEDGIGPFEQRPTRPNFAWGGVEPNLFGTDEFISFCRAVGCEPMICVNAGSGTAAEAARWIEYCNGPVTSPMGARRAANGHPEPYRVRHWEVGNELWGHWQYYWTTAAGYVDRFHEFAPAMQAADAAIELYACGAPVFWGKDWNATLIKGCASVLKITTDHPLIGGTVTPATEPLDVYRDFMAVPEVLEQKWAALRDDMVAAGIREPRLAVTELQLFAHLGRATSTNAPTRLTRENLVSPGTHAEALYDVLIYHAALRLGPFVEFVTHSATVNHGGGLRKERERVYANPCHYAQGAFADFAGGTPVALEVESARLRAPMVLPELKNATSEAGYGVLDPLAVVMPDKSLLISLVNRATAGALHVDIVLDQFEAAGPAEVRTLAAEVPWAANSLERPEAVKPVDSVAQVREGKLALELPPFSVTRVRVPR